MLKLTLVTPEKKLVEDQEVTEVVLPGFAGELNILDGHSALITTLTSGPLRYDLANDGEGLQTVAVSWGYCEIHDNHVKVLAETAETKEEIDLDRAKESFQKWEDKLKDVSAEDYDLEKLTEGLRKQETRINVASLR